MTVGSILSEDTLGANNHRHQSLGTFKRVCLITREEVQWKKDKEEKIKTNLRLNTICISIIRSSLSIIRSSLSLTTGGRDGLDLRGGLMFLLVLVPVTNLLVDPVLPVDPLAVICRRQVLQDVGLVLPQDVVRPDRHLHLVRVPVAA